MTDQIIFYNATRPPWTDTLAVSRVGSGYRGLILISVVTVCIAAFIAFLSLAVEGRLTAGSLVVVGFIAFLLFALWGVVFLKLREAARRYESQPAAVWRVTASHVHYALGGTTIAFTLADMTSMAVSHGFVLAGFARGQCAVIPEHGLVRADTGQPAGPGELAAMFRQFAPEMPPKVVLRTAIRPRP
ncbi:hypothetical protein G7066_13380 [Leucobacter coleopterorum]|uniref:YcxB-like protein n=1 Tax=Leucobacter coleopterorum TaxID=2714933 RepID=A0ABX6JYB5_9MICO|nr:hypothetical protein [Leucobacter coleopterorum]QIM19314.1 hypothetical protein G7066_13380 [Leucobacter coleopterorum]